MIFLHLEDLLHVAKRTLGHDPVVRDAGLLEAALARPSATAFGEDAYPAIHTKAAALLHSLARNADGDKRLALAGTIAFLAMNGLRLTLTNDEAYDLVVDVATGRLDDVDAIAERLETGAAASGPLTVPCAGRGRWRSRWCDTPDDRSSGPSTAL